VESNKSLRKSGLDFVKINVLKEDISKGKSSWLWNPIALALNRTFKVGKNGASSACDDFLLVDLTGNGKCASWSTPKKVAEFIDAFNFYRHKNIKRDYPEHYRLVIKRYKNEFKPFVFYISKKNFGKLYLEGED